MGSEKKEQVAAAVKDAMRSKDKARLAVLRVLMSEFKRIEVDERIELDDVRVLAVLDKQIKQRRESSKQYQQAGRNDLAEIEQNEINVIEEFMPTPLNEDEIRAIVQSAIEQSKVISVQEMGKVMALIKPQVQGRADMAGVSMRIKAMLGKL